jgi:hypothetical protein
LTENEVGQLISGKLFTADSLLINTFTMSYTGKHLSGSKTWDSAGKLITHYVAKLQQDGEIVSDTLHSVEKDSTTTVINNFRYEDYDSMKNWRIKTQLTAANVPAKIIKRKITYSH